MAEFVIGSAGRMTAPEVDDLLSTFARTGMQGSACTGGSYTFMLLWHRR